MGFSRVTSEMFLSTVAGSHQVVIRYCNCIQIFCQMMGQPNSVDSVLGSLYYLLICQCFTVLKSYPRAYPFIAVGHTACSLPDLRLSALAFLLFTPLKPLMLGFRLLQEPSRACRSWLTPESGNDESSPESWLWFAPGIIYRN